MQCQLIKMISSKRQVEGSSVQQDEKNLLSDLPVPSDKEQSRASKKTEGRRGKGQEGTDGQNRNRTTGRQKFSPKAQKTSAQNE